MNGGSRPVEVVIACHSDRRPLGRAVSSILNGNGAAASVTVVAHNIDPDRLRVLLRPEHRDAVRFLELHDGIPSPAGPFDLGLREARAPWVSIMGSDDRLLPGTVESWLRVQRRTGAEAVLTRLALGAPDQVVVTPPVRPLLRGIADPARDRLAYRSAPLGMIRRQTLQHLDLRMREGLAVGEDVEFTTRLVLCARTAVDRTGPAYVIGEDAGDRVTYVVRPFAEQIGFCPDLLGSPWLRAESAPTRRAVAVKLMRIHVFGAVHHRSADQLRPGPDRVELRRIVEQMLDLEPDTVQVLSRAEARLLDLCRDDRAPGEALVQASRARRRHGRPGTLLASSWTRTLDPQAPLRLMASSAAVLLLGHLRPPSRVAGQRAQGSPTR